MQVVENKTRLKLTINPEQFIRQIETLVSKFKGRIVYKINRNNDNFEINIKFPDSDVIIKIVHGEEYEYSILNEKQGSSKITKEFIKELLSTRLLR